MKLIRISEDLFYNFEMIVRVCHLSQRPIESSEWDTETEDIEGFKIDFVDGRQLEIWKDRDSAAYRYIADHQLDVTSKI